MNLKIRFAGLDCATPIWTASGTFGYAKEFEPYLELLPYVDTVLIMTIKAGFGGQKFLPEMLDKVRDVRRRIKVKNLEVRLEVDGGIAADTIEQAAAAGADAFVAGTAVYGADDPAEAIRKLRALAVGAA